MDCAAGAELIFGLAPGLDAQALRRAAETGRIEPCLRRIPIRPGDFLFVPPGTVHALLGGALVCEIQQSSDLTYRLWDWGRRPPRPLHIEQSCQVACYDSTLLPKPFNVNTLPPGEWHDLTHNDYFTVRTAAWPVGAEVRVEMSNPHGLVLNVVEGAGQLRVPDCAEETLHLGQTWFLPAGLEAWEIQSGPAGLRLLLSETLEL